MKFNFHLFLLEALIKSCLYDWWPALDKLKKNESTVYEQISDFGFARDNVNLRFEKISRDYDFSAIIDSVIALQIN